MGAGPGGCPSRARVQTLHLGPGPVTAVGFNALHNRLGYAMTHTRTLTESRRPAGTNSLFVAWEPLTNAGNPDVVPAGCAPGARHVRFVQDRGAPGHLAWAP